MFLNIGLNNLVQIDKVVSITNIDSAPIKRLVQFAKENNQCIDVTCGRKARAVIFTTDNYIILSSLQPQTISKKTNNKLIE